MAGLRETRRWLVEVSKRHTRVAHEAEDLAHDLILSALRRRLPLEDGAFIRSANTAARRHGAFLARCAGRRRARELATAGEPLARGHEETRDDVADPSLLSPNLQTTLFLLVLGLEKAEIRSALGVSDAALRKRFQALRAHGPLARPDLPVLPESAASSALRQSQVRLLPALMDKRAFERGSRRAVACGDPDGHGLIFSELFTKGGRTATTHAPIPISRALHEGPPCSTASSRTSLSSSSSRTSSAHTASTRSR